MRSSRVHCSITCLMIWLVNVIASYPLHSLDCNSLCITDELDLPRKEGQRRDDFEIPGSCHGLVCLFYSSENLILWNPTTGEFKKLRVPPSRLCQLYGLGYDPSRHDHKVVAWLATALTMLMAGNIAFIPWGIIRSRNWRFYACLRFRPLTGLQLTSTPFNSLQNQVYAMILRWIRYHPWSVCFCAWIVVTNKDTTVNYIILALYLPRWLIW